MLTKDERAELLALRLRATKGYAPTAADIALMRKAVWEVEATAPLDRRSNAIAKKFGIK